MSLETHSGAHQDPWRVAQARHPGRPIHSFDLHGAAARSALQTWKTFVRITWRGLRRLICLWFRRLRSTTFRILVLGTSGGVLAVVRGDPHPTAECWRADHRAFPWDSAPKYLIATTTEYSVCVQGSCASNGDPGRPHVVPLALAKWVC